jgi:hypothetical protein
MFLWFLDFESVARFVAMVRRGVTSGTVREYLTWFRRSVRLRVIRSRCGPGVPTQFDDPARFDSGVGWTDGAVRLARVVVADEVANYPTPLLVNGRLEAGACCRGD